ncbi:MAG TPA: ABC transporter permease [Ktedonobacterales bacterium]
MESAARAPGPAREAPVAEERQQGSALAFLRACGVATWLEYRNLRYYPSNLALAGAQELTAVGVWYFTAKFLDAGASASVAQYGGNYLAYVVVGVLLNQVCLAALNGPFTTISDAFWDKRLETYRLSIHGIWANVLGRLGWGVGFSLALQGVALVVLLLAGGLGLRADINLPLVFLVSLLLVAANAGLGVAGASLFFLLEVKSGQDPITWAYRYLVMLVSGLYVPLTILPGWLRAIGGVLPQTYGLAVLRALVLTGADAGLVRGSLIGLLITSAVAIAAGYGMLAWALRRAERRGGIGVVV